MYKNINNECMCQNGSCQMPDYTQNYTQNYETNYTPTTGEVNYNSYIDYATAQDDRIIGPRRVGGFRRFGRPFGGGWGVPFVLGAATGAIISPNFYRAPYGYPYPYPVYPYPYPYY